LAVIAIPDAFLGRLEDAMPGNTELFGNLSEGSSKKILSEVSAAYTTTPGPAFLKNQKQCP
jgi:hypothetical protein